jgi:sec-independent protein translocase protein TatC
MPVVLFQIWRFIEPALTKTERRYSLVLVPFSTVLFTLGAALGYWCSPLFFKFFIVWLPEGTVANWDYYETITMMAKMLLVFGISFQVPIIVIFLNKMGVVTRNLLIDYWRHSVVVIFTVIAVLTPTWDPVTLCICATPPCLLYVLSIWLIKWL